MTARTRPARGLARPRRRLGMLLALALTGPFLGMAVAPAAVATPAAAGSAEPAAAVPTPVDPAAADPAAVDPAAADPAAVDPAAVDPAAAVGSPQGAATVIVSADGTAQVVGWAFDPSSFGSAVRAVVTVDGATATTADADRPSDYLYAYGVPGRHGLWAATRLPSGSHTVCVRLVDIDPGADTRLPCQTVSVSAAGARWEPQGDFAVQADAAAGTITVGGWAFDRSAPAARIDVRVAINEQVVGILGTPGPTPYLHRYGVFGEHAFLGAFPASPGPHRVCVTALDRAPGADVVLGCRDVTVAAGDFDPTGRAGITMNPNGSIRATGWAFDRSDLGRPLTIAAFQNGVLTTTFTADDWSPALVDYGVFWKDFAETIPPLTRSTPISFCLAAINIGAGSDRMLACRTIDPRGTHPVPDSITDPNSLNVLVNKRNPLRPQGFEPGDLVAMSSIGVPSINGHALRAPAAFAVRDMFAAARSAGFSLDMTSGYRSYSTQQRLYDGYVRQLGQAGADLTSARPGFSEHQTGLAADISAPSAGCVLGSCFGSTAAGQWLAANAWRYGFILRYPQGATPVTGYEYEPWHFRFVGVETSTAMQQAGAVTYEQFLGVPAAPGY